MDDGIAGISRFTDTISTPSQLEIQLTKEPFQIISNWGHKFAFSHALQAISRPLTFGRIVGLLLRFFGLGGCFWLCGLHIVYQGTNSAYFLSVKQPIFQRFVIQAKCPWWPQLVGGWKVPSVGQNAQAFVAPLIINSCGGFLQTKTETWRTVKVSGLGPSF